MKNALRYPGSKMRLAEWINSFIPEHKVYLEPYFGSGAVFFNKTPVGLETINDIDGEIFNFFKVIRDQSEILSQRLTLTPYHRCEYDAAFYPTYDPVERARRFAVRCFMAFGCGNRYRNGFGYSVKGNSPNKAELWSNLPDVIVASAQRLKHAQIECGPALPLIKKYDNEGTVIYLDPPYCPELRHACLYSYEINNADHEELLGTITQMKKAKILLSGYDNDIYRSFLDGWHKEVKMSRVESGATKQECLWMNYTPQLLF